jgi:hypothetical protein
LLAPPNVPARKKGNGKKAAKNAVMMVLKPSLKSGTVIARQSIEQPIPGSYRRMSWILGDLHGLVPPIDIRTCE